eukprot:m.234559 g.234559  ORF g.234559 m.234559 type:complete len:197 (+) comp54306_c0_seq10:523-1113(+)
MVNFNPSPWLAIVPIIIKIFARCEAAALTLAVSLTVFNSSSLLGQLRLLSTKNLFLFIDLTAKGISGILRLSKRGLFFSLERGGVLIISSELIHLLSLVTHGQVFIHFQNLLAFMLATCFVVLSKACQFFVNPQETLLLLDGFLHDAGPPEKVSQIVDVVGKHSTCSSSSISNLTSSSSRLAISSSCFLYVTVSSS